VKAAKQHEIGRQSVRSAIGFLTKPLDQRRRIGGQHFISDAYLNTLGEYILESAAREKPVTSGQFRTCILPHKMSRPQPVANAAAETAELLRDRTSSSTMKRFKDLWKEVDPTLDPQSMYAVNVKVGKDAARQELRPYLLQV